jgi:chemotaxis protein methyltransferase CheR
MIDEVKFDKNYEEFFKRDVLSLLRIDLNSYKETQMKRRIKSLLQKHKCADLGEFVERLKTSKEFAQIFREFLTINVTEFYRNPEKYDKLRIEILPELVSQFKKGPDSTFKIWSAGCSIGAEMYTLAMVMKEHFPTVNYSITATDLDDKAIEKAKKGEYKANEIKAMEDHIKRKYMTHLPEVDSWQIDESLKKNIRISKGNLLTDTFSSGYDLILCRNVVIYFTEEAKDKLYRKFHASLKTGGVLFVGGTESILKSREIGFSKNHDLFYFK